MQQARRTTATVILNPTSGGGAGARTRPEIERELARRRIDFDLLVTEGPGHATALAGSAAQRTRPDYVIAAGGDGTAHEVANALLSLGNSAPTFAVLPVGTGNDFVKVVPGLERRAAGYDTIAARATRLVDAGHVRWGDNAEYFINGMGTGIDVEVVRQIERYRHLPGGLVYLFALLKALTAFRAIPVRATIDGESLERTVMMLALGNGRCIGGVFWLTPDASPEDGLLDVCVVDEIRGLGIARMLPRVLRGTHGSLDAVTTCRAATVEIDVPRDRPLFFQLDGELREAGQARCLRVELHAAALRVATTAAVQPDAAAKSGNARPEQVGL